MHIDTQVVNQRVSIWSVRTNRTLTPESEQELPIIDKAYALRIINTPAHEQSTLVTTLNQL